MQVGTCHPANGAAILTDTSSGTAAGPVLEVRVEDYHPNYHRATTGAARRGVRQEEWDQGRFPWLIPVVEEKEVEKEEAEEEVEEKGVEEEAEEAEVVVPVAAM